MRLTSSTAIVLMSCVGLVGLLANGCRPAAQGSGESETESVFFGNGRLSSKNVSVCWEFTSPATSSFRSELQSTISKAFAKTKLRFNGWGQCPASGRGADFRIFIYDDPAAKSDARFIGLRAEVTKRNHAYGDYPGHPRVDPDLANPRAWIFGRRAGIILSMTGGQAHPTFTNIYNGLSANGKKNLMISSSVHEFGHAIGMRHEDAHSNNKCEKFDEDPLPGDVQIGPWNPTSFMERCFYRNFNYEKGIVWPNELDIAGINKRYP